MWQRALPWLLVAVPAVAFFLASGSMPAYPPEEKQPTPPAVAVGPKSATSRVAAVTVYPNSALVTREVEVPAGQGIVELTVTPLPPTTVNSSLYSEGSDGVRVLTTRFRSRPVLEDTREEVRKLHDELKQFQLAREKIEAEMKAALENEKTLTKMESFMTITTMQSAEKAAVSSDAAITMSKHIRETRLESAREIVGLKQQIQANQEKAEFAQRKLSELSTGTQRTERDAVIVVERTGPAAGKVRLNYLVSAASWLPQYKLRAGKTTKDPVQVEYLAAVAQHTGEDWGDVALTLSTAEPMLNAAPPELQKLAVTVVPKASAPGGRMADNAMELEEQARDLRAKAQKDLNERKLASGVGLVNTAAALGQSFELFNPDAAMQRGCALGTREGPTVMYHLKTKLSVPSRADEQVLEVARLEMEPAYYYKAVPLLTPHVYRLADLTNKSNYVLLAGEATMYQGSDFVGQMNLPLVAIGETFTAGFGVDPQLQVQRQMVDKLKTNQGANQALKFDYRILISSYKSEPVQVQVWDRLPSAEAETVNVTLLKATPEVSADAIYQREQRPHNLLRWDVTVEPKASGEKAVAILYDFKLELDKQMTISSFQSAGSFTTTPATSPVAKPATPTPAPNPGPGAMMPRMTPAETQKVKAEMLKLSPEDRKLAEAQFFCAIDQESPLGSTGPIHKVMVKGTPVFLCCKGCVAEANAHPDETLVQFQKLMARMQGKK